MKTSDYQWDFNTYISAVPSFQGSFATSSFDRWRQLTGFDSHSKLLSTRRSFETRIFIRPNKYEPGRAHIIVYNWDLGKQTAVDVSAVLSPGAEFEIRDAQNYFGSPVVQGTYVGQPIVVPLNLSRMSKPVGNVERVPRHTAPEFAVFVLHQTGTRK